MSIWMKTAGILGSFLIVLTSISYFSTADKWGSIFAILALIITLLKQIIAFIGFLTAAIKLFVVLIFVALLLGVGLMILRSRKEKIKVE
ncbi:hypothetical protein BH20ACI1_BH20ACI1_16910 [soil metagenome]